MNQTNIQKLKEEYFKKGGTITVLPPNTYSDGILRLTQKHFPSKIRKPLTAGRGQGVSQANIVYSSNPEG